MVLVEPLSTEQLWTRPFPFGNSVGHLLLHLTGNLNYYIGTQIAGTGYVRDRPLEFADTSQRPKDEVLRDFDRAVDLVIESLMTQREADWQRAVLSGWGRGHHRPARDVPALRRARRSSRGPDDLSL